MIRTPKVTIEHLASARGEGTLLDLAVAAARKVSADDLGGVIAATFSNEERFPALSVRVSSALSLPPTTPAFDIQMACSAYPYALYLAGALARDLKKKILVIDGDVQTRLVNPDDHATGNIFSDAVTASVVSSDATSGETSLFDFYSKANEALRCPAAGPIFMDGMGVFTFVATEVKSFLAAFQRAIPPEDNYHFVPHQANAYMVRQLARALQLDARLLTLDEAVKNPGSCSIPLTLEAAGQSGPMLLAGFGAGYSASAAYVSVNVV